MKSLQYGSPAAMPHPCFSCWEPLPCDIVWLIASPLSQCSSSPSPGGLSLSVRLQPLLPPDILSPFSNSVFSLKHDHFFSSSTAALCLGGLVISEERGLGSGSLCPSPYSALYLPVTTHTLSSLSELQGPPPVRWERTACRISIIGRINNMYSYVMDLEQCPLLFTWYLGLYKIQYACLLYSQFIISFTCSLWFL